MTFENSNNNPLSEKTIKRVAVGFIGVTLAVLGSVLVGAAIVAVHFLGKVW